MKCLIMKKQKVTHLMIATALMAAISTSSAEVIDSSATGFSLKFTYEIKASTEATYNSLTNELGAWWLDDHTWYGSGENMSLQAEALG